MKFVVKALKKQSGNNSNTNSPQPNNPVLQPKQSFVSPQVDDSLDIKPEQMQNYEKFFNQVSKGSPNVPGKQAVEFFIQSGLPPQFLKQVW